METTERVLALSWKQPFAGLMLQGKIETRKWSTNYRGLVLICSSKKEYTVKELFELAGENQHVRILNAIEVDKQHFGAAIAIGRLVDCYEMTKDDEDKCFVKYEPGLYCHVYEDVKPIEPFIWHGQQGWKTVSQEIVKQINILEP